MRMHRVMLAAALSVAVASAGFAQEKGKSESGEKATADYAASGAGGVQRI